MLQLHNTHGTIRLLCRIIEFFHERLDTLKQIQAAGNDQSAVLTINSNCHLNSLRLVASATTLPSTKQSRHGVVLLPATTASRLHVWLEGIIHDR